MPRISEAKRQQREDRRKRKEIGEFAGGVATLVVLGCVWFITTNFWDGFQAQFGIYALIPVVMIAAFIGIVVGSIVQGFLTRLMIKPAAKTDDSFLFDDSPLTDLSPSDFEREVARLIEVLTGNKTEVCGASGDGGVDIKVYNEKKRLIGVIQCKRVNASKTVPPSVIRDLNTVKHQHQVNTAYLITTGRFSEDSQQLAKELGVRLIGGIELDRMRTKAQERLSAKSKAIA
jgi:hypothetical protein